MKKESKATAAKYMFYTSLVGFVSSIVNKLLDCFLPKTMVLMESVNPTMKDMELMAADPMIIPWKWILIGGTLLLTIFSKKLWKKLKI